MFITRNRQKLYPDIPGTKIIRILLIWSMASKVTGGGGGGGGGGEPHATSFYSAKVCTSISENKIIITEEKCRKISK